MALGLEANQAQEGSMVSFWISNLHELDPRSQILGQAGRGTCPMQLLRTAPESAPSFLFPRGPSCASTTPLPLPKGNAVIHPANF